MVKNENSKLNQALSHGAKQTKEYLEIILRQDKKSFEFSDKQMIENLTHRASSWKVREIRKLLEQEKIIKKTKFSSKNEKFYKVVDKRKANQIYKKSIELFVNNRENKPSIGITPSKIIINPSPKKFNIQIIINKKLEKVIIYPRSEYTKKICPLCNSGKLNEFKHKNPAHDLDKKCINCKTKFYYQNPETGNFTDGIIIGYASTDVRKYFHKNLIEKSRMKDIINETKKIMKN